MVLCVGPLLLSTSYVSVSAGENVTVLIGVFCLGDISGVFAFDCGEARQVFGLLDARGEEATPLEASNEKGFASFTAEGLFIAGFCRLSGVLDPGDWPTFFCCGVAGGFFGVIVVFDVIDVGVLGVLP